MAQDRRSARALAALLPAGALGLSVSLAAADAAATLASGNDAKAKRPGNVAERLQSIRGSVSDATAAGATAVGTIGAMAAGTTGATAGTTAG